MNGKFECGCVVLGGHKLTDKDCAECVGKVKQDLFFEWLDEFLDSYGGLPAHKAMEKHPDFLGKFIAGLLDCNITRLQKYTRNKNGRGDF